MANSEQPLFPHALLGFRKWQYVPKSSDLQSLTGGLLWTKANQIASCEAAHPAARGAPRIHSAPHQRCACGIYAYHQLQYVVPSNYCLIGAVAARGDVQLHQDGWRAAEVQVLAFYHPRNRPGDWQLALNAAEQFQIPLFVDQQQFLDFVNKVARPASPTAVPRLNKATTLIDSFSSMSGLAIFAVVFYLLFIAQITVWFFGGNLSKFSLITLTITAVVVIVMETTHWLRNRRKSKRQLGRR